MNYKTWSVMFVSWCSRVKHHFGYTIGVPFNVETMKPFGAPVCLANHNEVWSEVMLKGVM